jgi:hypothetical protein
MNLGHLGCLSLRKLRVIVRQENELKEDKESTSLLKLQLKLEETECSDGNQKIAQI